MTEPRPVSSLLHAPMVAIEAGSNHCVRIDVSGILAPGDRRAYVCNRCGKVTGWSTGGSPPVGCADGCIASSLIFCGRFVPPRAPSPDGVLAHVWRPELSADDVCRLIDALGSAYSELSESKPLDDDDRDELAALDALQLRLSSLRGDPT